MKLSLTTLGSGPSWFLESHCSFIKGGFVPPLLHYFQESQPFWDHEPFGKSGEHYGPSLRIMFYVPLILVVRVVGSDVCYGPAVWGLGAGKD